jgi:hypothetical protein
MSGFFTRIAARAGHPAAPRLARAVPKGFIGRMAEDEMQPVRRQAEDEEEMLQTLRSMEEEEEAAQPLRRQQEAEEEEEALQTLRRQPQEEEEPLQTLRRMEEEEEAVQPLRRQAGEEEEMLQTLRRQWTEEEEALQTLRRQMPPPDATQLDPETTPVANEFAGEPDELTVRSLAREATPAAAAQGLPPAPPPIPTTAYEPAAFQPAPQAAPIPAAPAAPKVVIEQVDVMIHEPAPAAPAPGGLGADFSRRLRARYLGG